MLCLFHFSNIEKTVVLDYMVRVLQSHHQAIDTLQEVGRFLERQGCFEAAMGIGTTIDTLASLGVATRKQTLLPDFFA